MNNDMKKTNRYMPLLMALCVVVGILIGNFYANHFSGNRLNIINSGSNRLSNLLHIIDDQYVDKVNIDSLVNNAIPLILAELDPHSVYISAKDAQAANDDFKGSFTGIGVEFTIRQDTIHVQNVISNGPAERAGVLAGDKIISVDGKPFVGKIVTNEEAMHRLKGPKDTKVKIGVLRYGSKKPKYFTITRGEIPQKSIAATYMLDDKTGYIRIKNFGETTYPELLIALEQLSQQGFSNLVIDLRDNTGGLLTSAIQIANEFLPKNKLIVYTEGRKSPKQEFASDGHGSYQKLPLVVLINEVSASASEIFAGAMQDNDRATIIGRRSFGKGLVQRPIEFKDGSMIRLTIAHYFTPSGRCIQKPYVKGDKDAYAMDIEKRFKHGELYSADSIHFADSLKCYTLRRHRVVYGGGGIMPDFFVPLDTTQYTPFHRQLSAKSYIINASLRYIDTHRKELRKKYASFDKFKDSYEVPQNVIDTLLADAAKDKVKPKDDDELKRTLPQLRLQLKALVARDLWDMSQYFCIINENNHIVQKALQLIQ